MSFGIIVRGAGRITGDSKGVRMVVGMLVVERRRSKAGTQGGRW